MNNSTSKATSKIKHYLNQTMETNFLFPVIAILILTVIWGATLNIIKVERTAAERTAMISSMELSETYEAQVLRVINEIDQTLKIVKYAHEIKGKEIVLQELNEKTLLPPAFLFVVSIADKDGNIVSSTNSSERLNIGDQDYFKDQIDADVLSISRPYPSSNSETEWTLKFSRRLNTQDGGFSGVVLISVDTDFFVSSYETSKLGKQGVLGIIGTDGVFRAGRSGDDIFSNVSIDYTSVVSLISNISERHATLTINSWDGVQRYTSARELFNLPLTVVVGLSAEEQFVSVYKNKQTYLWRATAISIVFILILFVLGRLNHELILSRKLVAEEHIAHAKYIEYLAYHDGLTGLPNRSLFTKLLDQNLNRARRYEKQLAIMFIDLDNFKNINDTMGHEAGDKLLHEIATRLQASLRDSDIVARMGGDEFVILLPDLEKKEYVAAVAKKILNAIEQVYIIIGQECFITISIGISIFPQDGHDEQTLTSSADIAMYQAKQQGKNNFQFYSKNLSKKLIERLSLESHLRTALACDELHLHYQPKWDVSTNKISGLEALLRWSSPDLGDICPGQFIPIAEDTGLIVPIGKWVLKTACLQSVAWQKENITSVTMAVNFSARQFFDPDLFDDLTKILYACGMDPQLLEIGINESLLMNESEKTLQTISQLKKMGIRIAIDDFGNSYASLSAIRRFPLDTVKIDRALIRDINRTPFDKELTESIITTGRKLSVNVLAQGVETIEQANFLREHDCHEFQGFYLNKPVPAEQIYGLLKLDTINLKAEENSAALLL